MSEKYPTFDRNIYNLLDGIGIVIPYKVGSLHLHTQVTVPPTVENTSGTLFGVVFHSTLPSCSAYLISIVKTASFQWHLQFQKQPEV